MMQPDRSSYVGGSDAGPIMRGEWLNLWLVKTNRVEREDLSNVFPVQLGIFTESLNRLWFTKRMNIDVEFPVEFISKEFRGGTVDGLTADGGILECKHVNQFYDTDRLTNYYYAQIQHYLSLYPDRTHAWLSVIKGNDWNPLRIERDNNYISRLIEAEEAFWHHVTTDTSPAQGTPLDESEWQDGEPLALVRMDMTGSNAWAHAAASWLENKASSQLYDQANKAIKTLVPDNAREASGNGIAVFRDKRGSLRVKKIEEK
tara:strand:+ start:5223 stop:5999 length:777 start_codon:yes stop_codon:yes gene_type:complete